MGAGRVFDNLKDFALFERVLAGVCLLTPLVLIGLDGWPARNSISAYYSIAGNQWFYFLLTAAVMMFVVNAFVREQHYYNLVLGIGLALIVLFNHKDSVVAHFAGVILFFAGNVVVIALFSRGPGLKIKLTFLAVMTLALVALLLPWWTLFWAEWLSMAAIAGHFLLDSSPYEYQAIPRGDRPSLAA